MRRRLAGFFLVIGALCLIGAAGLFVYNSVEAQRAVDAAGATLEKLQAVLPVEETEADGEMPAVTIDGHEYIGTVAIPRFRLELPVQKDWSYEGLRETPGRYAGSVRTKDLVIAAHNYQQHFGRIQELQSGDTVVFTDVEGRVFTYAVDEVETLEATAVEEMVSGDWDLTLFTCNFAGQARVTVRSIETG